MEQLEFTVKNSSFIYKITFSFLERNDERINERISINFANGDKFEYLVGLKYCNIDGENLFNEMISSESVGKFWHKHFKNKIEFKRVS